MYREAIVSSWPIRVNDALRCHAILRHLFFFLLFSTHMLLNSTKYRIISVFNCKCSIWISVLFWDRFTRENFSFETNLATATVSRFYIRSIKCSLRTNPLLSESGVKWYFRVPDTCAGSSDFVLVPFLPRTVPEAIVTPIPVATVFIALLLVISSGFSSIHDFQNVTNLYIFYTIVLNIMRNEKYRFGSFMTYLESIETVELKSQW